MTSGSIENIKIPYATEGVIRTAAIDDTVAPTDSVQLAVNMNFDRVGGVQTRPGIALAVNLVDPIISMGPFNSDAPIYRILVQAGTGGVVIYSVDPATFSFSGVLTMLNNNKVRYAQYLNLTWIASGIDGEAIKTFNGTTFGTTQVPAGFPKGDYIQAGFEGRVWVAQKNTGVVWYTDIVQFTPPSTYSLTFDAATNFIKNFSPQDGEQITGLATVPRALLVFKQNHIFRVYGATSVDAYPAYDVGTFSQESIVQTKDGLYFHHSSGFYKFTYDGQPTEISRRVIDFIKAISLSNYSKVCGIWDGYDAIEWSVGLVVVEGVTFTNCVMRYTISTQVWTIYDYTGNSSTAINNKLTAMLRFNDGISIRSFAGNNDGKVGIMGSGNTDFGVGFYYEFIDRWRSFTDMYAQTKAISGVNFYSENAAGANVFYQIQKAPANEWKPIDKVTDENNALFPNASTDDFTVVRLRMAGFTNGTPVVVHGIEILSLQVKGYDKN